MGRLIQARGADVPVLELAPLDIPGVRYSASAIAIQRIDTAPARMQQLLDAAALPVEWVEGLLRDLGRVGGCALSTELMALGRRTLEFPSRYGHLEDVAGRGGHDPGGSQGPFPAPRSAVPFRIHDSTTCALRQ